MTWLRIRAALRRAQARILWAGRQRRAGRRQRARVAGEALPPGTGRAGPGRRLARRAGAPGHRPADRDVRRRRRADLAARSTTCSPPAPRCRCPTRACPREPTGGRRAARPREVFALDAEAGALRFGDGLRGAPAAARRRAARRATTTARARPANVAAGAINGGPALPAGFTVTNPVRTWGGADAETVAEGERQVARFLQHRDRLVTAEDFAAIARRTPGVEIGRVEVLAAYDPRLGAEPSRATRAGRGDRCCSSPGDDPASPDAPVPDRLFLDAVCRHLDPRRLVTTELFLRGPDYRADLGLGRHRGRGGRGGRRRPRGACGPGSRAVPLAAAAAPPARHGRSVTDGRQYAHAERAGRCASR